jgi:hypothetical protein
MTAMTVMAAAMATATAMATVMIPPPPPTATMLMTTTAVIRGWGNRTTAMGQQGCTLTMTAMKVMAETVIGHGIMAGNISC